MEFGIIKKVLAILCSLYAVVSLGSDSDTPIRLVQSFIADYRVWNDQAHKLSSAEVTYTGEAMQKAEHLYKKNIISKYCKEGFSGQPIAFGSESSHHPKDEIIVFKDINEHNATIQTKHTDINGFVSDYEYRLSKENGRWYLDAVDYFDEDGKYPGL